MISLIAYDTFAGLTALKALYRVHVHTFKESGGINDQRLS